MLYLSAQEPSLDVRLVPVLKGLTYVRRLLSAIVI